MPVNGRRMLYINIEWLYHPYRDADNKKIYDCWSGDYIDRPAGRLESRLRAVPFPRVIGLIKTRYAIELLSKISEPKSEVLAVRYKIAHLRLYAGRYSVMKYLNTDPTHFRVHINLCNATADCLRRIISEKGCRAELRRLADELSDLEGRPSKYKFEGRLFGLFRHILFDSPEFTNRSIQDGFMSSTSGSYLEKLYEKSFEVYVEYQKEQVKFEEENTRNPNGFINGFLYVKEQDRLRQKLLDFRARLEHHHAEIIEEELTEATSYG
jgi:hypothetical protein